MSQPRTTTHWKALLSCLLPCPAMAWLLLQFTLHLNETGAMIGLLIVIALPILGVVGIFLYSGVRLWVKAMLSALYLLAMAAPSGLTAFIVICSRNNCNF